MNKKKLLIFTLIIISLLFVCGCQEQSENPNATEMQRFIGSWAATETDTLDFYEDGSCKYVLASGFYGINNSYLVITLNSGAIYTYDYSFLKNDTELSLFDIGHNSGPWIYTKQ